MRVSSFNIFVVVFASFVCQNGSQPELAFNNLMDAWFENDVSKAQSFAATLEELTSEAIGNEEKAQAMYYAGLGCRQLAMMVGDRKTELLKSVKYLKQSLELAPNSGEAHAMLANVYRMLVAMGDPDPEWYVHIEHRKKATELAPENPRVLMAEASALIFIPEVHGGDKKLGIQTAFEALGRFEFEKQSQARSWGEEETWALIGTAYRRLKRSDDALMAYERALSIRKNWTHVKQTIIPDLKKQIESK